MTDDFDDELRDALRARSGGPVGTGLAHDAVLGRAATIRRRRAVAAGSGALAVLALGALVLVTRDGDDRIAPADEVTVPSVDTIAVDVDDSDEDAGAALPTTTVDDRGGDDATSTTAVSTTAAAPTSTTAAPGAAVPGGAMTTTVPGATPPAAPPASTTATTTATTTTTTAAPSTVATTSPTTTAADPPATPPFTKTYQSSGGSITVDWNGSSLSLLSVQPASGYTAEIEDQTAARIRVRFRGTDDSRIEVRADNGQVEEIIS